MPWSPSDADILDLRVPRRVDRFRFELLDPGPFGAVIGEVHPDEESPVRITNDGSRTIPRTLDNLRLPASETQDINTLANRLRPVAILQNGSEYPLGEFLWADDSRPQRAWGTERTSSLVDRMFTLDHALAWTFSWAPGFSLRTIIEYVVYGLFSQDELDLPGLDTVILGAPIAWAGSVSKTKVLADLAALAGYFPPYVSNDGRLTMRPVPDLGTVSPGLEYGFGGRIIEDSIVRSDDSLDAPNRYTVTDTSGGPAPIVAFYDIPDSAPHSIANRGFPITRVETMQGLLDQAQALGAAKALAQTDASTYEWRDWSSTLDFRHDTWDVVAFLDEGNWLEMTTTSELRSGGIMNHTARRQYA